MIFILRSFRFKFGSSGSKSFKGRNGTGCIKSQKTVSAATTAPQNVPCRPLIMWAANMKSTRTSAWSAACAPGCVIPPPSSTRRTMPTPLPTTWWSSRPTWWCAAPGSGLVAAVRLPWRGKRVVVLEKSSRLGGNTDYAHAYFPVYTKWHEKAGMPDCREQAIEHYKKVTDGGTGRGGAAHRRLRLR